MLKKDVKNAKSFSVVLDEKDALELREICEVTGMSATAIIRYAVHYYLPSMRVHVEAMKYGFVQPVQSSDCQSDCQVEA